MPCQLETAFPATVGQRVVNIFRLHSAEFDEVFFGFAFADVDVLLAFVVDSGFPLDIAAVGTVVVTHEKTQVLRQGQNFLD